MIPQRAAIGLAGRAAEWDDEALAAKWAHVLAVRDEVNAASTARGLGSKFLAACRKSHHFSAGEIQRLARISV